MKRRDFVRKASIGLAGAFLPGSGFGQTKPCAPPISSVQGGTTTTTACGAGADPVADWLGRSAGPGVVWCHNFDSDSEIGAFRESAAVPTITRFPDGPSAASSYCMNIAVPQGLKAGETWTPDGASVGGWINHVGGGRTYYTTSAAVAAGLVQGGSWYRPLSAIAAGDNGKTAADPGAGGALPRRSWNGSQAWRTGYYGHPSEQARYPTWLGDATPWDGSEFYLQFWVKFSANRWNYDPARNMGQPNGKLAMIQCMRADYNRGELVLSSGGRNPAQGGYYWRETSPFSMYTAYGSTANADLADPQGRNGSVPSPAQMQPGYGCRVGVNTDCWEWPKEEWVNVLLHVRAGPHSRGDPLTFNATNVSPAYKVAQIEAWVVRQSQLANGYTKIWSKSDYYWLYGEPGKSDMDGISRYQNVNEHPPGFNAIAFNGYMNTWPAIEPFYQRYAQMILSRQPIPCPKA